MVDPFVISAIGLGEGGSESIYISDSVALHTTICGAGAIDGSILCWRRNTHVLS